MKISVAIFFESVIWGDPAETIKDRQTGKPGVLNHIIFIYNGVEVGNELISTQQSSTCGRTIVEELGLSENDKEKT